MPCESNGKIQTRMGVFPKWSSELLSVICVFLHKYKMQIFFQKVAFCAKPNAHKRLAFFKTCFLGSKHWNKWALNHISLRILRFSVYRIVVSHTKLIFIPPNCQFELCSISGLYYIFHVLFLVCLWKYVILRMTLYHALSSKG